MSSFQREARQQVERYRYRYGEGVVEAAQVAGEVVLRSMVGLCDRAARQGGFRFQGPEA